MDGSKQQHIFTLILVQVFEHDPAKVRVFHQSDFGRGEFIRRSESYCNFPELCVAWASKRWLTDASNQMFTSVLGSMNRGAKTEPGNTSKNLRLS
jgi:hypothetical protein